MYLSVKKEETVSKKYGCENKQHFILKKKLYPLVIALVLWWSLSQNPLFVKGSFLLYDFCCVCVICVFQVVAFPIFFPCLNHVKHLDRDHQQSRPNCLP